MIDLKIIEQNSVLGFIYGDALGVPVESKSRVELKKNPIIDLIGYGTHNQPKGSWSDDTSMLLSTMSSIGDKKGLDYEDLMNKFIQWYKEGKYTPNGRCFDIGDTTRQALEKYYLIKCDPVESGGENEFDNGNGSLMRMLPIVFYCIVNKLNDEQIYDIVKKVSSLTHRHHKSIFCCYLYVIFMINVIIGENENKKDIYIKFKENIKKHNYTYDEELDTLLKDDITKLNEEDIKSRGYVIDTLKSSIWCFLTTNNYKDSILKAVNLGGDTDTIGAITGSISGAYYKENLIKDVWFNQILNIDEILRVENKFSNYLIDTLKMNKNII